MASFLETIKFHFVKHKKLYGLLGGLIILGIFLLALYISLIQKISFKNYASVVNTRRDQTFAIEADKTLTQTFMAKDDLYGITLYPQKSEGNNQGSFRVEISDPISGQTLEAWNLSISALPDEQPLYLTMSKAIHHARGNLYQIHISVSDGAKLAFWGTSFNVYGNGALSSDHGLNHADLAFQVHSLARTFVKYLYFIAGLFILVGFACLYWLIVYRKARIENVFLALAIIFGLAFTGMFTPLSTPDEQAHFETAYRYSNVLTFSAPYATEDGKSMMRAGDLVQNGLLIPIQNIDYMSPSITSWAAGLNGLFEPCSDSSLVEVDSHNVGNIGQYLPTAIGISIGRLFNLGYVGIFYFGRLFNYIFFVILIYFAIRKIPFGKTVLFTIALLPITMQQAISCSYDVTVIGLSFLLIAYNFSLAYSSQKKWVPDFVILCIAGGWLATCKAGIYIFLCFLVFIVSQYRFGWGKKKLLYCGVVLASALLAIAIFNFHNLFGVVTESTNNSADSTYPLSFLFQHPFKFLSMSFNTLFMQKDFLATSLLGNRLAWLNITGSMVSILIFVVILTISLVPIKNETLSIKPFDRILFWGISICLILAFLAASLTWTPIGSNTIQGLQGRYFLPIFPLICFSFRSKAIVRTGASDRFIYFGIFSAQVLLLFDLFYYIVACS